jgi:drug/metabolite transporter (DMT)-like permease
MIAAIATLLFFAVTPVFANRAAGILGSTRANFWRLVVAALLLGMWTYWVSSGIRPASVGWFIAGGCVGFGVGGLTMFHALPRLGSNLSNLIVQCGSAIAAAAVEWAWLGTRLTPEQLVYVGLTIGGIGLGLSPMALRRNGGHSYASRPGPSGSGSGTSSAIVAGVALAVISAMAQGVGAVMSRKAFAIAAQAHEPVDAGTAAFERVLGGLIVAGVALTISFLVGRGLFCPEHVERGSAPHGQARRGAESPPYLAPLATVARPAAPWVILNTLTGPVFGVTCFQWALRTTPAGIVQPIVAAAPLLTIPFAAYFEGSRPRPIYYVGALLAAAGVTALALSR